MREKNDHTVPERPRISAHALKITKLRGQSCKNLNKNNHVEMNGLFGEHPSKKGALL